MEGIGESVGRVSTTGLRRVAVTGPESSGKTTLAEALARHYGVPVVPEASRGFYDVKGIVYEIGDILPIARLQKAAEDAASAGAGRILLLDTDLLTITVWSHVLYGGCPAEAEEMAAAQRVDLTLLLKPDLPWTFDPQRCHPELSQREDFFERLREGLLRLGRRFVIVGGDAPERLKTARSAIEPLL